MRNVSCGDSEVFFFLFPLRSNPNPGGLKRTRPCDKITFSFFRKSAIGHVFFIVEDGKILNLLSLFPLGIFFKNGHFILLLNLLVQLFYLLNLHNFSKVPFTGTGVSLVFVVEAEALKKKKKRQSSVNISMDLPNHRAVQCLTTICFSVVHNLWKLLNLCIKVLAPPSKTTLCWLSSKHG